MSEPAGDRDVATASDEELAAMAAREGSDGVAFTALVERFLSDRARLEAAQNAAKRRARSMNVTSFWGGIEYTLKRRGLRPFRDE